MSIDLPEGDSPPLLQLLPLVSETGAYSLPPEHLDDLLEGANALEFSCHRIDLGGCHDKSTLLQRISQALAFPDWFGHNWDALADCLADLGWLEDSAGYVLVFEQAQDLRTGDQDAYDTLIELLDEAAAGWREVDKAFWAFLSEP